MSIVAVHGPNTMFTTEGGGQSIPSSGGGVAQATKDPTNGLKFAFSVPNPGARPAADFDWSFTGPGSPAAQPNTFGGTVTFTAPGPVTIVCLVNNATAPPPANGTYTVSATATAGVPRSVDPQSGGGDEPPPEPVYDAAAYQSFILADHSIADVKEFLSHYELTADNIDDLISEEENGANRTTLLDWLNTQRA